MMRLSRRTLVVVIVVGSTLCAVILLIALLGPVADYITPRNKDRAASINATRQVLLACAAGVVAIAGLAFTARTYFLSKRSHLTERFRLAVAQLSSDKRTERLGGIYSLEHLIRDSPIEHDIAIAVLAAFVREQASLSREVKPTDTDETSRSAGTVRFDPPVDVQAAITVLGRRPERPEPFRLDFSRSDLRGINLYKARLDQAIFAGCDLQAATLTQASIVQADFTGANLRGARLNGAHAPNSYFIGARLEGAYAGKADLAGAAFTNASLVKANFSEVDLTGATLLDADLTQAIFGGATMHDSVLVKAILDGTDFRCAELRSSDGSLPARGVTQEGIDRMILDKDTLIPLEIPSPGMEGATPDEVIRRIIGAPKAP